MTHLTPEEKAVGRDNYYEAIGVSRRDFFKGVAAAGVTSGAGLGAMYFDYEGQVSEPVRVGIIGTGDEGNVLISAINPEFLEVKAICDIRPYNIHRAFHGDWSSPGARAARRGLMSVYGWKSEDEARRHVDIYTDYQELLKRPDIEGVIIALPLFLHHQVGMDAMRAGKHVLMEKLMAYNIAQCKEMARMARRENLLLATGHQRHYSVLYDNAVHLLKWGILGQLHHIRAQWHRGNLPGSDSWSPHLPGGEVTFDGKKVDRIRETMGRLARSLEGESRAERIIELEHQLAQYRKWDEDSNVDAVKYGYQDITLENGRKRSALEELCRWRLWNRTGGGLMAELGSHQLDAASIFISALRQDGKKARPLSVHAVGGRHIFPLDRDAADHVYCMFEFPGPAYEPPSDDRKKERYGYYDEVHGVPDLKKGIPPYQEDPSKRIVVSYSSINGNGFGGYGEAVLGTKGTMILDAERDLLLFRDSDTSTRVNVREDAGGPTMLSYETASAGAGVAEAANAGPVSRGYAEEMEHWAWCIRNRAPENRPRCHPEVALGDAVIALTTNVAMDQTSAGKGGYIEFQDEWFDPDRDGTPDGSQPKTI